MSDEQFNQMVREHEERGFVRCENRFMKKENCVKRPFGWQRKIDFIYEMLCPSIIWQSMKTELGETSYSDILTEVIEKPEAKQRYEDWLNGMVSYAKSKGAKQR